MIANTLKALSPQRLSLTALAAAGTLALALTAALPAPAAKADVSIGIGFGTGGYYPPPPSAAVGWDGYDDGYDDGYGGGYGGYDGGYGGYDGYYGRRYVPVARYVTCRDGRRVLWRSGYNHVEVQSCRHGYYRYTAWRNGKQYLMAVDSQGDINRLRRIR